MYTTPIDAARTIKWKAAMQYAVNVDAYGHQDWRVPTINGLNVLFNNRAAIGGFTERGHGDAKYWSSTDHNFYVLPLVERFSDGYQFCAASKFKDAPLRC